ncbi:MAG: VOC family protein, partial [Terracidiphilus sp.]
VPLFVLAFIFSILNFHKRSLSYPFALAPEREIAVSEPLREQPCDFQRPRTHRAFRPAGVHFHQALKKEPWGARTFVVSDPDENLILFAGPAAG